MLFQRCPRCEQGQVFRTLWRIHERCPVCKLQYEREPGFFYGAMYFSYGLGLVFGAPTAIALFLYGVDEVVIFFVVVAELAALSPLIFRYSRIAWLYFDQRFDPR